MSSEFVYPSIGSIVAAQLGPGPCGRAYAAIPDRRVGLGHLRAGFLGAEYDPVTPEYLALSAAGARALRVEREAPRVLDAYGRNRFGLDCLRARRLVQAGVRFVLVSQRGWDTHCDAADALSGWLAPALDQGLSALIEDLAASGLLESVFVACMGEMGRTPRLNAVGGRDHWPCAACAVFAGAGVPRGQVVGHTDDIGAWPIERPVRPQDVAATLYAKLGIDVEATVTTPDGRSVRIAGDGAPIVELGTGQPGV